MKDFTHLTINNIVFIREDNWRDAWKRSTLDGAGAVKVNHDQQNEEKQQETEARNTKPEIDNITLLEFDMDEGDPFAFSKKMITSPFQCSLAPFVLVNCHCHHLFAFVYLPSLGRHFELNKFEAKGIRGNEGINLFFSNASVEEISPMFERLLDWRFDRFFVIHKF